MCYAAETPPPVAWVQDKIPLHAHAILKGRTNRGATLTLCGRTPPDDRPWYFRTTFPIGTICKICAWSYGARTGFNIDDAGKEVHHEPRHKSHQP